MSCNEGLKMYDLVGYPAVLCRNSSYWRFHCRQGDYLTRYFTLCMHFVVTWMQFRQVTTFRHLFWILCYLFIFHRNKCLFFSENGLTKKWPKFATARWKTLSWNVAKYRYCSPWQNMFFLYNKVNGLYSFMGRFCQLLLNKGKFSPNIV